MITRRQMLAPLSGPAACPPLARAAPAFAAPASEAHVKALLDSMGENLLRLSPESATSLGIDIGPRAPMRYRLTDKSAAGQAHVAATIRADLARTEAIDSSKLSFPTRTSVEVIKSAYRTALEGFALPYGDVAVGSYRNTPYVVIQNAGAYLDIPKFLDSDHPVDNAGDAEAYLTRMQSYARQLDGELGRIQAARGAGL